MKGFLLSTFLLHFLISRFGIITVFSKRVGNSPAKKVADMGETKSGRRGRSGRPLQLAGEFPLFFVADQNTLSSYNTIGLGWWCWESGRQAAATFPPAREAPRKALAPANVSAPGIAIRMPPLAFPGAGAHWERRAPRVPAPPSCARRARRWGGDAGI